MKKLVITSALILFVNLSFSQLEMKARSGTYESVVSTEYVWRVDASYCGFNDLSLPFQAQFEIKTIRVDKWREGRIVETTYRKEERFVRCQDH